LRGAEAPLFHGGAGDPGESGLLGAISDTRFLPVLAAGAAADGSE
jgi:hypothetical protein